MKHKFTCIDAHTCGNPVRLVASGGPELVGNTMEEKRRYFQENFDWIRTGLMFEPRGHDMMSGSILFPPHDPANDFAVLFIETSGCLPMCGHGTIGTITIAIEEGLVVPKIPGKIRMEAPAGLIEIDYIMKGDKVHSVKLTNVPSYLVTTDLIVECPILGPLKADISYGGNYYAIIDIQENFAGLQQHPADHLISWSRNIRDQINNQFDIYHPDRPGPQRCSHVLWAGEVLNPASTARNAVFYGDKAIDRSPCGTGTSARMAQWYAKGKLKAGEMFVHESIIGSVFTGMIERETTVGGLPAIVPSVEGWAKTYGYNTIFIDDEDPYAHGFQVI